MKKIKRMFLIPENYIKYKFQWPWIVFIGTYLHTTAELSSCTRDQVELSLRHTAAWCHYQSQRCRYKWTAFQCHVYCHSATLGFIFYCLYTLIMSKQERKVKEDSKCHIFKAQWSGEYFVIKLDGKSLYLLHNDIAVL